MPMDATIPQTANKFVIFPAEKLAQAQAYKAWGDAQFRALSGEENGILGLLSTDAYGQHVTTYYGPNFTFDLESGVVEEPEDGPTMRADGVLSTNWVRPAVGDE